MNLRDFLVFKSPRRIDWPATEAKLTQLLQQEEGRASEKAMRHSHLMKEAHRMAKKYAVRRLYQFIQEEDDDRSS